MTVKRAAQPGHAADEQTRYARVLAADGQGVGRACIAPI